MRNARYGKIWNLLGGELLKAVRLPVKAENLKYLENDEVVSYQVSGYLEMGPSVGISANLGGTDGRVGEIKITTAGPRPECAPSSTGTIESPS